jgi:hypothetical protein
MKLNLNEEGMKNIGFIKTNEAYDWGIFTFART